jgi:hypothetical protein
VEFGLVEALEGLMMDAFSISIGDKEIETEGDVVVAGSIRIGEFEDNFHASLSYWNRGDYISQWRDALNRLLRGETHSAVVTSMHDPLAANFIFWWVMYLVGDIVYIQNHVLFLSGLEKQFDEADMYSFVPERETQTEEGESISEWEVGILSIREFAETI